MLKEFRNAEFVERVDDFHELRAFLREPVDEWHEGAYLPDELIDERERIFSKLEKYNYNLPENPTKEDYEKYSELQKEKMQTEGWQEWTEWLRKTDGLITTYRKLEQETKLAKEIIRFNQNGKNIFEISPFLTKLLENTKVGNIRFKDFVIPYNTIYFHFGNLEGFEYPVECYEEKFDEYLAEDFDFETDEEEDKYYENKKFNLIGAFVSKSDEKAIDICLCFKDPTDNSEKSIYIVKDHRNPTFEFSLSFGKWDKEIGKTIYNPETTFNQSTITFCDIWDNDAEIGEIEYEKVNRLTNEPENCYHYEHSQYVLMDKAVKLIVNCICYLNSSEKDIKISATNEQAEILLNELRKTKKTQQKNKLKQKLEKQTYSKIHFLGSSLKKYFNEQKSENELEPHWRRGHWRNQPFGTNLSESKLIWIKPTIVRKDKGEPKKGHIYEI